MTVNSGEDITTRVLAQIRDEMRSMRGVFDARLAALEGRIESFDADLSHLRRTIEQVHEGIQGLDVRIDYLAGKIEALERRVEDNEQRMEDRHRELFHRIDTIHSGLKKFASITNEAILHYAEEMDAVRERLDHIEHEVGISLPSE